MIKYALDTDITSFYINGSTDPLTWGTVPTSLNAEWDAVEVVSDSTGFRLPTEAQWEYADPYDLEDPTGPVVDESSRVFRGGDWSNPASGDVRSASRGGVLPNFRNGGLGFRFVRP